VQKTLKILSKNTTKIKKSDPRKKIKKPQKILKNLPKNPKKAITKSNVVYYKYATRT
jgi:hypothetical protein